jgi:hypothetical protein
VTVQGTTDARLDLVLAESLRALTQQQTVLDNLRARASLLLSAAALVTPFFGPQSLINRDGGVRGSALVLIVALSVVTLMTGLVIWPRWRWNFRTSARKLLDVYVDQDLSIDDMRRQLALTYEGYVDRNDHGLARLQWCFVVGMAALFVEVLALVVGIRT